MMLAPGRPAKEHRARGSGFCDLLCAALVAAAFFATVPSLEMGVNDDWSYLWTAHALAKTGAFSYSGWSEPMIGIQAVWAACLFRIFGFSFTLARFSTLPFAAGMAVLLNRMGRLAGLNARFAFFGALALTLSPLFIPLATSFMTDIPSCFFWLACVYFSIRAACESSLMKTCAWIAIAAASGVAGGTVRQVVWVVPLTTLPVVAWVRRREREAVFTAAIMWCSTVAAAGLCMRWFNAQPRAHVLIQPAVPGWPDIVSYLVSSAVFLTVGGAIFLIPVMFMYVAGFRVTAVRRSDVWAGAGVCVALMVLHWWFRQDLLVGNTVTVYGVLNGTEEALGSRPIVVNAWVRGFIKVLLALGAGATFITLASVIRQAKRPKIVAAVRGWFQNPLLLFLTMLAPGCLAYIAALIYRGILFDRYLIPILPLVVIPLLWLRQRGGVSNPPASAWVALAVFALYGVGATHDYFAASRARQQALSNLLNAGVQRLKVSAGLETDAWAELEYSGQTKPAIVPGEKWGDLRAFDGLRGYQISPPYWFWAKVPDIDPVYLVTYSRLDGLDDAGFSPVPYRTWLPASTRFVYTQVAGRVSPAIRPGDRVRARRNSTRAEGVQPFR
jgi:hypothetical protein